MARDHKFQLIFFLDTRSSRDLFLVSFSDLLLNNIESAKAFLYLSSSTNNAFWDAVSSTFDSHHYVEKMVLFH